VGLKEKLEQEELEIFKDGKQLSTNDAKKHLAVIWSQRLIDAKDARSAWDIDFIDCQNILSNNIPLNTNKDKYDAGNRNDNIADDENYIYKVNTTINSAQWKVSYLEKADINTYLRGKNGIGYSDKFTLEAEVNWMDDYFKISSNCKETLTDWVSYGYGVRYLGWNDMDRDVQWKTGKPLPRNVHCRRFWVDHCATDYGWENRRWQFELIQLPIEDAMIQFPDFADKFYESPADVTNGDADNKKDIVDIYLIQYKKKKRQSVVITSAKTTEGKREYMTSIEDIAEAKQQANIQDDDITAQNMTVTNEFEITRDEWFQVYYSADLQELLTEPEHIGQTDHYAFLHGFRIAGDIYPRSTVFLLKDAVNIKCLVLTDAVLKMMANGHKIAVINDAAIENKVDFYENMNGQSPVAFIKDEFIQQGHTLDDAIKFIDRPVDHQMSLVVANYIDAAIKELNGNIDVMQGQSTGANDSGIKTSLLQNSGQIYTKAEELELNRFEYKQMMLLLQYVGEYMQFEHTIPNVTTEGDIAPETINENNIAGWVWEDYICDVYINNDPETLKQIKAAKLDTYASAGWLRPPVAMAANDIPNAEKEYSLAIDEKTMRETYQFITSNPQIMAMIQQQMQSGGQPEQIKTA